MKILKKIIPVVLGASGGFAYWYFIGCTTGGCPLTSTWHISTLYGAMIGATFLLPGKKQQPQHPQQQG